MASLISRTLASELTKKERGIGCVKYEDGVEPTYGYQPSIVAGIVFITVFFLSFAVHSVQVAIKRKWWYSVLVLGALGELIGWAARLYASQCPYNTGAFNAQISVLIISPCFFSAGYYYILSQLITKWGQQYSPLSARLYLLIFSGADLISIIVQAIGGASSAKAGSQEPAGDTSIGVNEMLAGIIVQLVSMGAFLFLAVWVLWRSRDVPRTKGLTYILIATAFSAGCVVIRNFYRAVELSQGYSGYLITHEVYFDVLDGALMVLASVVFNVVHPAWGLAERLKYVSVTELGSVDGMKKDRLHWPRRNGSEEEEMMIS